MLGTIDIAVNAKFPNMPLEPMFAYVGSASSIRVRNVPRKIGKWQITNVYFTAHYPDDSVVNAQCVLNGGVWVGTIEGCQISGKSEKGYTIYASGIDENGNEITDSYVLGKGDINILEADGTITPGQDTHYVHLLSAESDTPKDGDLYPTDYCYMIWQNGQANSLGTPFEQISAFVESEISSKQDKLTDIELSALDDIANEYLTIVKYDDNTTSAYTIVGTLSKSSISAENKEIVDVKAGKLVTSIGNYAFENCEYLTSFIMSDSVTTIGDDAFNGCVNLSNLKFSNNVTTIGSNSFLGCQSLSRLELPEKLIKLESNVFTVCTGITEVVVPKSITSIGASPFYGCTSLTSVTFVGKTLAQVQAMPLYPWGITNTSIIKTWNETSQEFVQNNYLPLSGSTMSGNIQMGNSHMLKFDKYAISYNSPDTIGFSDQTTSKYALLDFTKINGSVDKIAFEQCTVQRLGGVNGILSASENSWSSISADPNPNTLYVIVED